MAGSPNPQSEPAAGCVVFLVDESRAQETRVAEGTRSKAESIATAINSLLAQLAAGPALDVALVGYRAAEGSGQDIGCRWSGPLAGRRFVSTTELADHPVTVEDRVRKVPGSGGIGVAREETVRFPVWYVPVLGNAGSRAAAYEFCRALLSEWVETGRLRAVPPLVLSLLADSGDPVSGAAAQLQPLETASGRPLVFHAHLGSSARVPPVLYPSTDVHLAAGPIRDGFLASSYLPDRLAGALRQSQVMVNSGARGFIYNAKMVDLIRFLGLVKAYRDWAIERAEQARTPALAAAERVVTLVLLLDRSVNAAARDDPKNVWVRLQQRASEVLADIAKRAKVLLEVAVLAYASDRDAGAAIQNAWAGALAGRDWVPAGELEGAALRVEETTEQVSNGVGGLISITRKRPVYIDLPPMPVAERTVSPAAAFHAAGRLLAEWKTSHPDKRAVPVVLHLTRGSLDSAGVEEAAALLGPEGGVPVLYHLVLTESPHRSLAYPDDLAKMDGEPLKRVWEITSPLAGREEFAGKRPGVSAQSRGLVVNGKFDLLLEAIESL